MHGGFGGGHSAGSGGLHGGHSTYTHHQSQPPSSHHGGEQSAGLPGMTSLVHNGQGFLGSVASWLSGHNQAAQHPIAQHVSGQQQGTHGHNNSQAPHIADNSWASSALQAERSPWTWRKVMRIPGVAVLLLFVCMGGWLYLVAQLGKADPDHAAKARLMSQLEWRRQLVGNNLPHEPEPLDSHGTFGSGVDQTDTTPSYFGMPRATNESSSEESTVTNNAFGTDPNSPILLPSQFIKLNQPKQTYREENSQQPIPLMSDLSYWRTSKPAALPSYAAQATLSSDQSRNFRHRIVAER